MEIKSRKLGLHLHYAVNSDYSVTNMETHKNYDNKINQYNNNNKGITKNIHITLFAEVRQ
jgi:hypothetical protein